MITKTLRSFLYMLASLSVIACSEKDQFTMNNSSISKQINCHVASRKSIRLPIEKQATISFLSAADKERSLPSGPFNFHAQSWSGVPDGERALRIWITKTDEAKALTSYLYQFNESDGPFNQFRGSHGFTGLNYIYDQESGSELQFWCDVLNRPK